MDGSDDLARWDDIASAYAAGNGAGDSFHRRLAPFLHQQFGDVSGLRALDLGCGHGWLAAELHGAGSQVVGIDGSLRLVEAARARHPGIEFAVHDLTGGLPAPGRSFDRVVSHLVLMDLPVLDGLLRDVAAALTADGVFVFSILHPCFFDQPPVQDPATGRWHRHVRGYLGHEQRWITTFGGHRHYHRPLSWYVGELAKHGLVVTALHEPPTLPQHTRPERDWTDYERWFSAIPTMLAIACRRRPPGW